MSEPRTAWEIRTLQRAPSMNEDTRVFIGTYLEAVAECHQVHRETGRTCSVVKGAFYWHRVEHGKSTDKNTNSGSPEYGRAPQQPSGEWGTR